MSSSRHQQHFISSPMDWLIQLLHLFFLASLLICSTAISNDQIPKVNTYIYIYIPLSYFLFHFVMAESPKLLLFFAAFYCLHGKFSTKQHWGWWPNTRISSFGAIVINYSKVTHFSTTSIIIIIIILFTPWTFKYKSSLEPI